MKTWIALFVKEWKDSRYLLAFLVITLVALQIYGWYLCEAESAQVKGNSWRVLPFAFGFLMCIVASPFLLARSLSSEFRSETHYQWFSLPVKRYVSVLCKYAVALSNGCILWIIALANVVLLLIFRGFGEANRTQFRDALSAATYGEIFRFLVDFWLCSILPGLLYMMLLLAVVTVMEGVKFSVRRFQGSAALLFFGGTVYLYARFYRMVTDALDFLGPFELRRTFWTGGSMQGFPEWSHLAYPFLVFTLLIIIGLWLFEKRVEI